MAQPKHPLDFDDGLGDEECLDEGELEGDLEGPLVGEELWAGETEDNDFRFFLKLDLDSMRPKRRSECQRGPRPCPWVGCYYHLYWFQSSERRGKPAGELRQIKPPWEMSETCTKDVVERGGATLEEVGAIMNLTRERVRQIELAAIRKLRQVAEQEGGTWEQGADRAAGCAEQFVDRVVTDMLRD